MTFIETIKTVYTKYATFSGRATRSEYWWFFLFECIVCIAFILLGILLNSENIGLGLMGIFFIASFIPMLALRVRRLHDISKSGWWIFLGLVPYVGEFVLFIFSVMGSDGENEYGPGPLDEEVI